MKGRLRSGLTLLALLLAPWTGTARAHLQPIPLALWGGYDAKTAQCSRSIGYATARCATAAWFARNACLSLQIGGGSCDTAATAATIERAHNDAPDVLDAYCRSDDYDSLAFGSVINAYLDVDIFCKQLEDAAASVVYGPAMHGDSIMVVDATAQRCIQATAEAATALFRFAFGARQHALDLIAAKPMTPNQKSAVINRSTMQIARARSGLQRRIAAHCSDAEFNAVYHRSPSVVLTLLGTRGDCLAGAASVQNAAVCPVPICGNGMQEMNEECDDGNRDDSDGCRNDCTKSAPQ